LGCKALDACVKCGACLVAETLEAARSLAYKAADKISFAGVQRRNDIGATPTH
jgi:phosphoribosylamine-glycine ligase